MNENQNIVYKLVQVQLMYKEKTTKEEVKKFMDIFRKLNPMTLEENQEVFEKLVNYFGYNIE